MAWHRPSQSAIIPPIFCYRISLFLESRSVESLKPLLLLVVLGGVGYGVYVALNQAPSPEPSPRVAPNWNKSPQTGAKTARKSGPATPAKPASAPAAPATSNSPLSAGSSLPFGIGRSTAQSAAAPAPTRTDPPPQVTTTAQVANPPPLATSARPIIPRRSQPVPQSITRRHWPPSEP